VQGRNLSFELCITASSWETRRLKADLAEAKAQKAKLEEQIQKLHRVRMELDVMYDNEKTGLIKQLERDRETVRSIIERKCLFLTTASRLFLGPPT
jgi:predicted ArsR family transcriptional regulator